MTEKIEKAINLNQQKIDRLINSYGYQKLRDRLHNYAQGLDELEQDLTKHLAKAILKKQDKLTALAAHLHSLHPLSPLKKGFALLKQSGKI